MFDGQTLPTLKCAWNVGTAATVSDLTDATPTNKTYISCPAKAGLAVGTHQVRPQYIDLVELSLLMFYYQVSVWADIGGGNYQRLTPDSSISVYGNEVKNFPGRKSLYPIIFQYIQGYP